MKRYCIFLISLATFVFATEEQNLKTDIEFLASESCFGRGLANEGIFFAERYIVNELEILGVKVYTQGVNYKINIPQKAPLCVINGDTLKAAYDLDLLEEAGNLFTPADGGMRAWFSEMMYRLLK